MLQIWSCGSVEGRRWVSKLSELSGHPESLGAVSMWGVPAFWLVWIGFLVLAAQDLIR